jgi:hypothetical protein
MDRMRALWKVAVCQVFLRPNGGVDIPEVGWLELPGDMTYDLKAGEMCQLSDGTQFRLPDGEISLELPEGGTLDLFQLDPLRNLPIPMPGAPSVELPINTKLQIPLSKTLRASDFTEFPLGTKVIWPIESDPANRQHHTKVLTDRKTTLLWLPEGGHLVLPVGGRVRTPRII